MIKRSFIPALLQVILLITCQPVRSQAPGYSERIHVHVDRNHYLSGEMIWFALYCLEEPGLTPAISRVAYVELLNGENIAILQQKVQLEEGMGDGCLQIPGVLPGGIYTLRAYTSWLRNHGAAAFYHNQILILHPSMPFPADRGGIPATGSDRPATGSGRPIAGTGNTLQVVERGMKERYRPGDTIDLEFSLLSPGGIPVAGTASLSVCMSGAFVQEDPAGSLAASLLTPGPPEAGGQGTAPLGTAGPGSAPRFLPETVGPVISGRVTDAVTREPVAGQLLLLSFIDTAATLYTAVTGNEGRFYFLPDETGEREFVVQPADSGRRLLIEVESEFSDEPLTEPGRVSFEPQHLEELYSRLFTTVQVNRAYGLVHRHSREAEPMRYPLVDRYDHRIILGDYIRLPLMEEVFRELGKRVVLSRSGSGYDLSLLDVETNRVIGPRPCFFLDGVPFFNSAEVLALDPADLEEIRLKSSMYFVHDLRMDGMIDMQSRRGDASLVRLPGSAIRSGYRGFPGQRTTFRQDPAARENRNLPLHMNTLFFAPSLRCVPGTPCRVRFIAPDSKGSYDMILRAIGEGGLPGESAFTFEVR